MFRIVREQLSSILNTGRTLTVLMKGLLNYPTPANLSYMWNFGSLALLVLFIQLVSGILIVFWYPAELLWSFERVIEIVREVEYGWVIRFIHLNCASAFFIAVYIHLFRSFYYVTYLGPRNLTFLSGFVIYILLMFIAFLGYVLPAGQMSYWAFVVITSFLTGVPVLGDALLKYFIAGFSFGQPVFGRIFCLHYLLPFVILALVVLHILLLHSEGSSNPINDSRTELSDKLYFHPYYTRKDYVGVIIFLLFICILVAFCTDYLNHSINYIKANPLQTPTNIVPEWYFLPFYGILKSVPDKNGGLLLMIFALLQPILIALFVPYSVTKFIRDYPYRLLIFWIFIADLILLGWAASFSPITPYIEICRICTLVFFLYFGLIFFQHWKTHLNIHSSGSVL